MCGIAGIAAWNLNTLDPNGLRRMGRFLAHRGPDDEGMYLNSAGSGGLDGLQVGLLHRRLKILDLSEAAHMPMSNESGKIWITFNGEIYNHRELRAYLIARGHVFRSRGDSEVILHAYEEWGEECVGRLNGMWAFAIWDETAQKLLLSRDRFGIKPLYYLLRNGMLVFASEIKAILALCPEEREPDLETIGLFLSYGIMDHGQGTFFARIRSLPPAHFMSVSGEGVSTRRYWDLAEACNPAYGEPQGPLAENFLALLEDAVKRHLPADVPIGASLSGGIDSTTVVSLASRHSPGLPTFSSVFPSDPCDETPYALEASRSFRTDFHAVCPDVKEFMTLLPRIIWHQDEPGSAYGVFPQWKVMEQASRHVRVLLDGQGGDELLGGYNHYFPHYLKTVLADPRFGSESYASMSKEIGECIGAGFARMPGEADPGRTYRTAVLSEELRNGLRSEAMGYRGPFPYHLDNVLYHAMTRDTLPALLHYQDRMSMAFSLESRVPLLDYRIAEFCFRLPYTRKLDRSTTKVLLRDSVRGIIPESIRCRKDKKGYPAPFSSWLRKELMKPVQEILFSREADQRGVLHRPTLRKRWEEHTRGEADHAWEIWRWLSLEIWFREFIDQKVQERGRLN